jgi:ubiquitin related modifier 1
MEVKIEFSGGMELLFDKQKELKVNLAPDSTLQDLIDKLKNEYLKEKEELFYQAGTVRPGIIVLINDTDWELCENEKYKV